MFWPEYPIRTERLLLRPFARGDVDALYAYHRLPEVHRYLYSQARNRAEVEALVAERAGATALTEAGQELHLVAELAGAGELVGDCVFFWRSEQHQKGEIGYTFNPAYHGRGLATEAAVALLRLGFESMRLHRITGHLDARNIASARVLERAGMRREAHLVENEFIKGEWSDELVYAMLRREWEAGQARG
jgi:RimJ/RimL family protein N-acetyltransferase